MEGNGQLITLDSDGPWTVPEAHAGACVAIANIKGPRRSSISLLIKGAKLKEKEPLPGPLKGSQRWIGALLVL